MLQVMQRISSTSVTNLHECMYISGVAEELYVCMYRSGVAEEMEHFCHEPRYIFVFVCMYV
jgi:hypothetical protein